MRAGVFVVGGCAVQEWPPKSPELASGALLSRLGHDEIKFELLRQRKCAPSLWRVLPGSFPDWLLRDMPGCGKCWRATITGRKYAETASRATACRHLCSRRMRYLCAFRGRERLRIARQLGDHS